MFLKILFIKRTEISWSRDISNIRDISTEKIIKIFPVKCSILKCFQIFKDHKIKKNQNE